MIQLVLLEDILKEQYSVVKVFKKTDEKSIVLLRHNQFQKNIIYEENFYVKPKRRRPTIQIFEQFLLKYLNKL